MNYFILLLIMNQKNENKDLKSKSEKNAILSDELILQHHAETLNNPNKIGNILIKYISNDLKDVTWEKEGKQVNFNNYL